MRQSPFDQNMQEWKKPGMPGRGALTHLNMIYYSHEGVFLSMTETKVNEHLDLRLHQHLPYEWITQPPVQPPQVL